MIFLLSLITAPLLVLAFLQLGFLPYHSELFTWNHRLVLLLDLAMLLALWPGIAGRERVSQFWLRGHAMAFLLLGFSMAIPGGFLERVVYAQLPAGLLAQESGRPQFRQSLRLTEWVFSNSWLKRNIYLDRTDNPQVGRDTGRGLPTPVLQPGTLPREDGMDTAPQLDLGNRNYRYAALSGMDLRNVNFDNSDLGGAYLGRAQLQGASFHRADLRGAYLEEARLEHADLSWANLSGAYLYGATLERSTLNNADLTDSSLESVRLAGTRLIGTLLDRARLVKADLRATSTGRLALRC